MLLLLCWFAVAAAAGWRLLCWLAAAGVLQLLSLLLLLLLATVLLTVESCRSRSRARANLARGSRRGLRVTCVCAHAT